MSDAYALHWEREAVNDFSSNIRNVSIYEAIQRLLETAMGVFALANMLR